MNILQNYKSHVRSTRLKDELYKWQLLEQFRGRPDVNAPDFAEEYKSVKFGNLVYQLTTGVGNHINREDPEVFRNLFKDLYDEQVGLKQRIANFSKESLNLYRKIGGDKGHHQDERAISAYLTFHNPEQYTFYKSSYYRAYCAALGIKPQSSGSKYTHYLSLLNELIETQLKNDQELVDLVSEILEEHKLPFSWLLLAQDILYFTYESNPKEQNDTMQNVKDAFATWLVNNPKADYFDNDKQKILNELTGYEDFFDFPLYETKKSEYQHLIADIDEIIYAEDNSPFVQYSERTSSHRPRAILGKRNYFKFLEEYFTEEEINFARFIRDFNREQLQTYLTFLLRIINAFDLKQGDERLTFNYYDNRLVLTIGQRYVWVLKRNEPIETFGALSLAPISSNGEFFEGVDPKPFYNKFSAFDLSSDQEQSILDGIETELNRSKKSGYRKNNHKADFEAYVFNLLAQANMKTPLNQILYGPPGTGKTYNTIDKVVSICEPTKYNENDHESNKLIYDQLISQGRVVFTTFHQSLSYEDFIEGIKPSTVDGGQLTYEIKDGLFKLIADKAKLLENNDFDSAYDRFIKDLIEDGNDYMILKTPKNREFRIKVNSNDNLSLYTSVEIKYQGVLSKGKLKKEYFGENALVGWEGYANAIIKLLKTKYNLSDFKKVDSSELPYAIIIDEINRGNVSAIFGELITLIEEDKRLGKPNQLKVSLPYSKEGFGVPKNLYIIGTMNTADRSVEALDTALRRRFSFVEMLPDPRLLKNRKVEGIDLTALLTVMNQRIEALVDRDHTIGHAYFMHVTTLEALKTIFYKNIIPLLQEYFYGNYAKMAMVLGEAFFHEQGKEKVIFAYQGDDYYDDSRKVFKLKSESEMALNEFESAINKMINPE